MDSNPLPEKKKRGRKSKKELELIQLEKEKQLNSNDDSIGEHNNIDTANNINGDDVENTETKIPKKRGRKPRGGKIFPKITTSINNNHEHNNIILHLKCSMSDINNDISEQKIEHFQFNETKIGDLNYEVINKNNISYTSNYSEEYKECHYSNDKNSQNDNDNVKNIHEKIEALSFNLHTNNVCDKKSACFWCTFDFDNNPIYIPKYELNNSYNVYGCFCSPECACAFLMNDKDIDNASRFERYQLLNNIYCKIYDYKKNIKPAPNPYYTLEKFYGNLTIQEYRKLLKNERLLLIVDKPLTRILPELYDENNDNNYLNKGLQNNSIMKKNINISKVNIMNENFNVK